MRIRAPLRTTFIQPNVIGFWATASRVGLTIPSPCWRATMAISKAMAMRGLAQVKDPGERKGPAAELTNC